MRPRQSAPFAGARPSRCPRGRESVTRRGSARIARRPPFHAARRRSSTTSSEDCLFVNVWRPAAAAPGAKLPVMVWIHGGAFVFGSGSCPGFSGVPFAGQGVVLVTFNYRLGRLGFFAFPALSSEHKDELKANYAYMDQIAALQVGAAEHRRVRRRSEERHDLRRVRGRRLGAHAPDLAALARPVPEGDQPVRRRARWCPHRAAAARGWCRPQLPGVGGDDRRELREAVCHPGSGRGGAGEAARVERRRDRRRRPGERGPRRPRHVLGPDSRRQARGGDGAERLRGRAPGAGSADHRRQQRRLRRLHQRGHEGGAVRPVRGAQG